MPNLTHRIRRLRYLVVTSNQTDALAIRKNLCDRSSEELLPVLARAFDENTSSDRVLHIPKLQLHLKVASEQDLMEMLPELIQQQLRDQLQSLNGETMLTTQSRVMGEEVTTEQNQFDILVYYLHGGSVPWQTAHASASDIAVELKETCQQQWSQLLDYLRHQDEPTTFYFRLLQLLPVEELLNRVNDLSELIPQEWRTAVLRLLTSILASQPGIFNRNTQLRLTAAILSESGKIRESNAIPNFASLVESILLPPEKNQFPDFIASLPASAAMLLGQKQKTARRLTDTFSGNATFESNQTGDLSFDPNEETTSFPLSGDRESSNAASENRISETNQIEELRLSQNDATTASQLSSDRELPAAFPDSLTSGSQEIAETSPFLDREVDPLNSSSSSVLGDLLSASFLSSPTDNQFPLAVKYAGLVLIHPFITRFLEGTDVKETDNQDLADFFLPRAAALLHFLATGSDELYEYELGFIKILLGLQPEIPLTVSQGLIETSDREESEALLTAVISYWSVLKNTSVSGLRSSFLQRPGLLREVERGWQIQVEPKPFDMLLDHLPWSISVIKLPWMKQPIYTEWQMP